MIFIGLGYVSCFSFGLVVYLGQKSMHTTWSKNYVHIKILLFGRFGMNYFILVQFERERESVCVCVC